MRMGMGMVIRMEMSMTSDLIGGDFRSNCCCSWVDICGKERERLCITWHGMDGVLMAFAFASAFRWLALFLVSMA